MTLWREPYLSHLFFLEKINFRFFLKKQYMFSLIWENVWMCPVGSLGAKYFATRAITGVGGCWASCACKERSRLQLRNVWAERKGFFCMCEDGVGPPLLIPGESRGKCEEEEKSHYWIFTPEKKKRRRGFFYSSMFEWVLGLEEEAGSSEKREKVLE